MRRTLALFLSAFVLVVCGCDPSSKARVVGSGVLVTVTPLMEPFDEVHLFGSFRVVVALGGAPSLSIRTDDNIMPFVDAGIEGDTLIIRRRDNLEPSDGVTVNIVAPDLSRFAVDGSAIGDIKDVGGDAFALVVNGAGSITVSGKVADLVLEVHGAGGIEATDLEASTVDLTLEGAGRISTYAVRKLNMKVTGLGVVEYRGDPQITQSASALSRIIKMD